MKYELHPACAMWPQMSDDRLNELATDIKENGQERPIVLLGAKILDGRNRALACELAGIEPTTEPFLGKDPIRFTISMNLHRRQLSDSQRAMVAAEIANMRRGDFHGNQHKDKKVSAKLQIPTSVAKAAEMLNVKPRNVGNAKVVLNSGDTKLIDDVKNGKVRVSVAAKSVTAKSPKSVASAPLGGPQFNAAKTFVESYEAVTGELPSEDEIQGGTGVAAGTANKALVNAKLLRAGHGVVGGPKFTKAQDEHVEARIKVLASQLDASFEQRVRDGVDRRLAHRNKADGELLEKCKELISRTTGRVRPPFTNDEYKLVLSALHPDAQSDKRTEAFILFKKKEFLLRSIDEKDVERMSIPSLPQTPADWEARKRAVQEARRAKR